MTGSTFGKLLNLTTFGESHGYAVGGVLQGFPAQFSLDLDQLQRFVSRRSPGKGHHASERKEADTIEILSGIFQGKTLGTPIAFMVKNKDSRPGDYDHMKEVYRPSHADFTWQQKFGFRDYRGGGRSSARETVARVIAGGMALQYLEQQGIQLVSSVASLGHVDSLIPSLAPTRAEVDAHALRCVDTIALPSMEKLLEEAKSKGDTLGGIIHTWVEGLPVGLGEPVFDKLQARLAQAMMSINAAKGFSYGKGFDAARMRGSQHNDVLRQEEGKVFSEKNKAGGILGGISTGETLTFDVAFKPIASIQQEQETINQKGELVKLEIGGRHDVTVLPRAVPIVEAMTALTIMDFYLMQKVYKP